MPTLPAASFSAIVTDPPYGLSFMGKEWDHGVPGEPFWREALRVLKPGGMLLAFGGTRTYHRLACAIEDAGFEIRDCLSWLYGQGFPKALDVGKATSLDAWHGYGTALKPAWEPILLAMKPLDGTFAQNALAHGVAGVNVDGCRVGDGHSNGSGRDDEASAFRRYSERGGTNMAATPGPRGGDPSGRFPANLILDEAAGAMLDEQSGELTSGANPVRRGSDKFSRTAYGEFVGQRECVRVRGVDSGGASRFFYCAKASKRDRNSNGAVDNRHPTVKPTNLMRWLVRLVTMPEGTRILDPFAGSGSTGVACALEGVDFLGIERDADSAEVARARIAQTEKCPANSPGLFD